MMAGTVVTLSFVVFAWSQSVSSSYNNQYNQTVTTEIDKLKEKLVFEYVYYDATPKSVKVYLLNCGTIDAVTIVNVYVSNSSGWLQSFSKPPLKLLNGTPASDQLLDRGEERHIDLSLSDNLKKYAIYSVKVVTVRGATFDSSFVA